MTDVVIDRCPCEGSPRLGSVTLEPLPESVPRARRWFRKLITPYRPSCSVDDCVLLISELVTNAILHGRCDEEGAVRVEWFRSGSSLRVEVHNPGLPARVRLRQPDADDAHGRGLLLVDALASSWQSGPSRFGGTAVCFELADAWPATRAVPAPTAPAGSSAARTP
ncbi:ATP-binding protein [Streptomyces sp. SID7958]|uniref:ATP-binding protein n=2 Tax=unclassified Streptomyces TaxID=2593676 RepID=A0A6G3QW67_9ACTN|nr:MULTISPECIES: ATP-binding protein [unclassified Streptomyces]NEA87437.1 ATP-binding protein [Streptomyces sp. SID14436]NEC81804.1 ATP-binding protein [Streptomyces sp. SID7958]